MFLRFRPNAAPPVRQPLPGRFRCEKGHRPNPPPLGIPLRKGVPDGADAGKSPDLERIFKISLPKSLKLLGFLNWTDRSKYNVFLHPATLTPWNRWKHALRDCAKSIMIGKFPASRPNGSAARHRGRHRRAAWPGGIGGSNRTGSGCQAHWRMGRRRG